MKTNVEIEEFQKYVKDWVECRVFSQALSKISLILQTIWVFSLSIRHDTKESSKSEHKHKTEFAEGKRWRSWNFAGIDCVVYNNLLESFSVREKKEWKDIEI